MTDCSYGMLTHIQLTFQVSGVGGHALHTIKTLDEHTFIPGVLLGNFLFKIKIKR